MSFSHFNPIKVQRSILWTYSHKAYDYYLVSLYVSLSFIQLMWIYDGKKLACAVIKNTTEVKVERSKSFFREFKGKNVPVEYYHINSFTV